MDYDPTNFDEANFVLSEPFTMVDPPAPDEHGRVPLFREMYLRGGGMVPRVPVECVPALGRALRRHAISFTVADSEPRPGDPPGLKLVDVCIPTMREEQIVAALASPWAPKRLPGGLAVPGSESEH